MPKIFTGTVLAQEENGDNGSDKNGDDEGVELYKDCLNPDEASYGYFNEPGGVFGIGIAIAKNAGLEDIEDEEEEQKFLDPVGDISQAFWGEGPNSDTINSKEVLGRFIEAYGCKPVKMYINENIEEKREEEEKEKWAKKWGVDE